MPDRCGLDGSRDWYICEAYQRADETIREDICDRLWYSVSLSADSVNVKVAAGIVTLSGIVTVPKQKRLAKDIVAGVNGVKAINNRLRVKQF